MIRPNRHGAAGRGSLWHSRGCTGSQFVFCSFSFCLRKTSPTTNHPLVSTLFGSSRICNKMMSQHRPVSELDMLVANALAHRSECLGHLTSQFCQTAQWRVRLSLGTKPSVMNCHQRIHLRSTPSNTGCHSVGVSAKPVMCLTG